MEPAFTVKTTSFSPVFFSVQKSQAHNDQRYHKPKKNHSLNLQTPANVRKTLGRIKICCAPSTLCCFCNLFTGQRRPTVVPGTSTSTSQCHCNTLIIAIPASLRDPPRALFPGLKPTQKDSQRSLHPLHPPTATSHWRSNLSADRGAPTWRGWAEEVECKKKTDGQLL